MFKKDLCIFTNLRKYRLIQLTTLCILVLCLLLGVLEFYAQGIESQQSNVGERTFALFIIFLFFTQFLLPKHAVEAVTMEQSTPKNKDHFNRNRDNITLLILTPLPHWKILLGKLGAVVTWGLFGIFLTLPIFTLSIYMGGLTISVLMRCGIVIMISSILFALIGMVSAKWNSPTRAKAISYGIILTITFLPLIPITPFVNFPLLDILSPLSALFSILRSNSTTLWVWNVCLCGVLCVVIYTIIVNKRS